MWAAKIWKVKFRKFDTDEGVPENRWYRDTPVTGVRSGVCEFHSGFGERFQTAAQVASRPDIRSQFRSSLTQNPNIIGRQRCCRCGKRSLATWQQYLGFELVSGVHRETEHQPGRSSRRRHQLLTVAPTEENMLFFSGDLQESAAATRVFYDKRGLRNRGRHCTKSFSAIFDKRNARDLRPRSDAHT